MGLIEKELKKVNFIIAKYKEEMDTSFEGAIKTITDKLKIIIGEYASKHQLQSTDGTSKPRYTFTSRLKDSKSLKEKFIRGDLYNNFLTILPDGFDENNAAVIQEVKKKTLEIDDLIGIRILTDLNIDSENMLNLIKSSEFASKAQAHGIIIKNEVLEKQPVPMKNGLNIFKIKGEYDKYQFELQIKSRIISAWGDLEHSIFYKNYFISPVRGIAQEAMNHTGKLLIEIDQFLESIRSSSKNYVENAKFLNFIIWLQDNYENKIKSKIEEIDFRIEEISIVLFAANKKIDNIKQYAENPLRFDHFELPVREELILKYTLLRNRSYNLKIFESIILSWILAENEVITEENIEAILNNYLAKVPEFLAASLKDENSGLEEDEIRELLTGYHKIAIASGCNESFLLNLKRNDEFLKIRAFITDIGEELFTENGYHNLLAIIYVALFNGNIKEVISVLEKNPDFTVAELLPKLFSLKDKTVNNKNDASDKVVKTLQEIIEKLN